MRIVMVRGREVKMSDEDYERYKESLMPEKTYVDLRIEAYGSVEQQMEFITEHGLEAWKKKVAEIKAEFPKE